MFHTINSSIVGSHGCAGEVCARSLNSRTDLFGAQYKHRGILASPFRRQKSRSNVRALSGEKIAQNLCHGRRAGNSVEKTFQGATITLLIIGTAVSLRIKAFVYGTRTVIDSYRHSTNNSIITTNIQLTKRGNKTPTITVSEGAYIPSTPNSSTTESIHVQSTYEQSTCLTNNSPY